MYYREKRRERPWQLGLLFDYDKYCPCPLWSFNNYVDKKRGVGVSGKSTVGHVTKDRKHVKCQFLSTQGGWGSQDWVKCGLRSC